MESIERRVQIVDENDNVIGYKFRHELDYKTDRVRSSALMILSPRSLLHREPRVLLTQRSESVREDPGQWGPSVVGKLEEGDGENEDEDYDGNILKEMPEEIGVADLGVPIHRVDMVKFETHDASRPRRMFLAIYAAETFMPVRKLVLDPAEVKRAKWVPADQLAADIRQDAERAEPLYVPHMQVFRHWLHIWRELAHSHPVTINPFTHSSHTMLRER